MKKPSKKENSLRFLKKKVWEVFSQYIRLKEADSNGIVKCYTCGQPLYWKEAQAGHGLGGRSNLILFDEEIVKPQCKRCNIFLGGNYDVFHEKLIEENGLEWFKNKIKIKYQQKQFTVQELQDLYRKYFEKCNQLLSKF